MRAWLIPSIGPARCWSNMLRRAGSAARLDVASMTTARIPRSQRGRNLLGRLIVGCSLTWSGGSRPCHLCDCFVLRRRLRQFLRRVCCHVHLPRVRLFGSLQQLLLSKGNQASRRGLLRGPDIGVADTLTNSSGLNCQREGFFQIPDRVTWPALAKVKAGCQPVALR